jgi:anti-anti-sigma regulatory factor
MASNFKISAHRNDNNLHLKLAGDFDGTSAHQLLKILEKNRRGITRVFIHTSSLKQIHPFGRDVFHKSFDAMSGQHISLLFTGDSAVQLAPEGSTLL